MRAPFAAFAAAALFLASTGCRESALLDPMSYERRYAAYEESFFFPDGRAMQPPPAHTVRADWRPAPASRAPDGAWAERIPIPVTLALLERGRVRYDVICGTCHGLLGDGNTLVAENMALRPPPSLHAFRDRPPGYLYAVATEGFGLMPGYTAQLTDEERWAVVAYVQALQRSQWTPIDAAPPEVRARLGAGGAP